MFTIVLLLAVLGFTAYGYVRALTPVGYSSVLSFDIQGPTRTYRARPDEVAKAYRDAAGVIQGVRASLEEPTLVYVDAFPTWRRIDDGFGVLATFRFDHEADGTRVTMRARGKVGGLFNFRASYGAKEFEREVRQAIRSVSGLRPDDERATATAASGESALGERGVSFTWPAAVPSLSRFTVEPITNAAGAVEDVESTVDLRSHRLAAPQLPTLVVNGVPTRLSSVVVVVGRRPICAEGEIPLQVDDASASRTHFAVGSDSGKTWIEDRGSANGTQLVDSRGRVAHLTANRKTLVPPATTIHFGDSIASVENPDV